MTNHGHERCFFMKIYIPKRVSVSRNSSLLTPHSSLLTPHFSLLTSNCRLLIASASERKMNMVGVTMGL